MQVPPLRSRFAVMAAIGLTWLVTAMVVVWWAFELRRQVRSQIVDRSGDVLRAIARSQVEEPDESKPELVDPFMRFTDFPTWNEVLAARYFETNGELGFSLPDRLVAGAVPTEAWSELVNLRAYSRYREALRLDEVVYATNRVEAEQWSHPVPLLDVFVPLPTMDGSRLDGVAEFILDGAGVAREFQRFDQKLAVQAGAVLVAAMAINATALAWAFRHLARVNALLVRRTDGLQRANQELAQSARVAALGAITAHLLHGLKNPVSGLRLFVESQADTVGRREEDAESWADAVAATHRMQRLVQQVARVLEEQNQEATYEISLSEIGQAVVARTASLAERRGVQVVLEGEPPTPTDNRVAGILTLLLVNLLENAIEATPRGRRVWLRLGEADGWVIEVGDEGSGLDREVQERLFHPQRSTKDGGSGLGLAITRQLAAALTGSVSLVSTGSTGTVFRVTLPRLGAGRLSAKEPLESL